MKGSKDVKLAGDEIPGRRKQQVLLDTHLHAMVELGGELLFEVIPCFSSKQEDKNTP